MITLTHKIHAYEYENEGPNRYEEIIRIMIVINPTKSCQMIEIS